MQCLVAMQEVHPFAQTGALVLFLTGATNASTSRIFSLLCGGDGNDVSTSVWVENDGNCFHYFHPFHCLLWHQLLLVVKPCRSFLIFKG